MTINPHHLLTSPTAPPDEGVLRRVLRRLGVQDWAVFAYLLVLNLAVLRAPDSAARTDSLQRVATLLFFFLATLISVRGGLLRDRVVAPLLYRVAIYGTVQLSYFFFADLLPVANPVSVDRQLYQLDLSLFGFEPAIAMDAWITPATSEWFAFFYFGYFFLLAVHVIPILLGSRRERLLGEFSMGMLCIFCVGHILYMLVPGYGPYRAIADQFQHTLPSGLWMDLVMATVEQGGAQKDIFPSLHTAAPTFMALFSLRHRDKVPFKYSWPVVAFFGLNIVIATMFLRWHYVIDVVAGLLLAVIAMAVAARVTAWELTRRRAAGLPRSWPLFFEEVDRGSSPDLRRSAPTNP